MCSRIPLLSVLVIGGWLVFAPGIVVAGPVGMSGSMNWTGIGSGASVQATLVNGDETYTAHWAGELNWVWGDGNSATTSDIPDGLPNDFYTYCVDISDFLGDPQTVTIVESNNFTNGVTYGGSKAAWLFNTYADGIRTNADGLSSAERNYRAAALQVAIWEAMYDTAGDLGWGAFTLATNGSIRTYAAGYVSDLYNAGASAWLSSPALILSTNSGQDQITRISNVESVPEPSTLALLGFGLGLYKTSVLGFNRRRRSVHG